MENKKVLTLEGKENLLKEQQEINNIKLPAAIKRLEEARSLGDLSENAEYDAAKEENQLLNSRLKEIEDILNNAEIIDTSSVSTKEVSLGCIVRIKFVDTKEEEEYKIVGEDEADIFSNKINKDSLLARAILGKKKSQTITFEAPNGDMTVEILDIKKDFTKKKDN